jgi:UDP-N-acetylglucosamine:LPS N-acetylglucosamine transferase
VNVLIISASMGAGHDGAARELQRRLERDGHQAQVADYLAAFPFGIGRLVRFAYQWELRLAPRAYEWTYRLWSLVPALAGPLMLLLGVVTDRRVRRWVDASGADVVVSTYPLASLALGRARRTGRLEVPVATFITDFAVHPLWAAAGVDLHLTVHPRAAAAAHHQTGAPAAAPGPMVGDRFRGRLPGRAAARARLGIPEDARVALLVAGSWGVGAVRRTFDDIVATGTWSPLAVCGRNERLRRRLASRGTGWVQGWSDDMPSLVAAADVLIENAGGLTCMEAFSAGLPVVSYRPIAGHGRGNAAEMEAAGVAAWARPGELRTALDATLGLDGARRRAAARRMFAGDAAHDVVALAAGAAPAAQAGGEGVGSGPRAAGAEGVAVAVGAGAAGAGAAGAGAVGAGAGAVGAGAGAVGAGAPSAGASPGAPAGGGRRRGVARRVAGVAAAVTASLVGAIALTSLGAGIAAAHGVAVAHPPAHAIDAYVALRVGQAAADDSRVAPALAAAHVTAIVSGSMAATDPIGVWDLAAAGVDVANGGWGAHRGLAWTWHADVQRAGDAIRDATGVRVRTFVPGRRIDGLSLVSASWDDQRVVLARTVLPSPALPAVQPGGVYILDARGLAADDVLTLVRQIEAIEAGGQPVAPLSDLRG